MYHGPAKRPHENGDLNICRKYTRMEALRELKVLNIVSPYDDLTQLEDGNEMSIITELNPLNSTSQGPKNLPGAYMISFNSSKPHRGAFFSLLWKCVQRLFSPTKDGVLNYYLNQYYILASDLRLRFSKQFSNNTICYPSANIFTVMPLFLRNII